MSKNKDPAFLFYSNDFIVGVSDLTMEERGQYITLMCLQHQKGRLSEKTIRLSLGLDLVNLSVDLLSKFSIDDNGYYYNERLEIEIEKRAKYADTMRENGKKGGRPKKEITEPIGLPNGLPIGKPRNNLIENENKDVIIDKNKDIIVDVIDYLNLLAGTNFRNTTDETKKNINARVNEGFNLQDFKTVIEKKCIEWKDTDMQKHLKPSTLFCKKHFEQYLNQLMPQKSKQQQKEENKQQVKEYFESNEQPQYNSVEEMIMARMKGEQNNGNNGRSEDAIEIKYSDL